MSKGSPVNGDKQLINCNRKTTPQGIQKRALNQIIKRVANIPLKPQPPPKYLYLSTEPKYKHTKNIEIQMNLNGSDSKIEYVLEMYNAMIYRHNFATNNTSSSSLTRN